MNWIRIVAVMLALLPLTACGLSGGPIEGQVLEAGTNKPIAGAIVIMRWEGTYDQIVESKTACYHVETATTDAQGRYTIPAWHEMTKGPFFNASPEGFREDAYKPGYVRSDAYFKKQTYRQNIDLLEPFKGARGRRLEYLQSLSGKECGSRDAYAGKLMPLYRALYEEARSIAVTPEEKHLAGGLHYSLDSLELGEEESLRRLSTGQYEK